jgi:Family of unknown function (DUF5856)
MDEIIDLVFDDADQAHREHLLSESYAEHEALAEFYDGARGALDAFVEAAIALDLPLPEDREPSMLQRLEGSYVTLAEGREATCGGDATLQNLHDELAAVYLKAIYRLKRLR